MIKLLFCLPIIMYGSLLANTPSPYEVSKKIGDNFGRTFREIDEEKTRRKERYINARNSVYIMEMLDDYTPNQHEYFIACIECSDLPPEDKVLIEYKMRKMKKSYDLKKEVAEFLNKDASK